MNKLVGSAQVIAIAAVLICPALALGQGARAGAAEEPQPISYGDEKVEATGVGISGGAIAGAELVVAVEALFGVKKLWPYLTFPIAGAVGGGVGGYYLEKASPKGAVALLVGSMALIIPTAILASSARAFDPEEEGAVSGDADGGFSLELGPSGAEQGDASTEVQSRPEGAPTDAVLPPGAEGPPAERMEGEEPEAAPSEESPEEEAAPEDESESGDGASARNDSARRSERLARIRRASAGSLFYMDGRGTAAISVPAVEVRPVAISAEDAAFGNDHALEIFVPLFRMDLP